ncbi:hypothetical protein B0T21DRAFT_93250 [Apiosordaria backusii]|uniref:Uncharacterized protein n=1 Tax=Apiosordaria backusii TaxID=314023 RepID=A0AA40K3S5_9PEZI|nr:hypothetical protein B0T21DRAFT_93250 [Apiosordaria backusii]
MQHADPSIPCICTAFLVFQDRLSAHPFAGSRDRTLTCHSGILLLPERPEIPPPPFATIPFSHATDRDFADRGDNLEQIHKRHPKPAARVHLSTKRWLEVGDCRHPSSSTSSKWRRHSQRDSTIALMEECFQS